MDNNWSPFPQGREPSMEAGDWRSKLPGDKQQKIINKIISTLKTYRPIPDQEGLEELERSAASLEEKSYAAATSQLDYLQKNSQEMGTILSKPQNTISNSLESNGKGLPVSVADQGQSITMSVPANQSQTRQEFVPNNIQHNIHPARVHGFARISSALSPTMSYQRKQIVPQNFQNNIPPAGVQIFEHLRLTGSSPAQQNKMNTSETIAELLTTIKNRLDWVRLPMQETDQQLQHLELIQSQTHQMPQFHQIRLVGANNMLQANSVPAQPDHVIVDTQLLKQELEKKMCKNQLQQPNQQLSSKKKKPNQQLPMQQQKMPKPPQMVQEKQQKVIQQLEQHTN